MTPARLSAACAERGLTLTRRGLAYLITGPGVHVLCVDLRNVSDVDLQPVKFFHAPKRG